MRLPWSRASMSAITSRTVSTVPSLTALWSSSSVTGPRLLARCDLVLLERAHGAGVLVLGGHHPPDRHEHEHDQHRRRVVRRGEVELVEPRHAGRAEREEEDDHGDRDPYDRHGVDPAVPAAEVPGPGLEGVALAQPEVDRDRVGDVQADGADPDDREERPRE